MQWDPGALLWAGIALTLRWPRSSYSDPFTSGVSAQSTLCSYELGVCHVSLPALYYPLTLDLKYVALQGNRLTFEGGSILIPCCSSCCWAVLSLPVWLSSTWGWWHYLSNHVQHLGIQVKSPDAPVKSGLKARNWCASAPLILLNQAGGWKAGLQKPALFSLVVFLCGALHIYPLLSISRMLHLLEMAVCGVLPSSYWIKNRSRNTACICPIQSTAAGTMPCCMGCAPCWIQEFAVLCCSIGSKWRGQVRWGVKISLWVQGSHSYGITFPVPSKMSRKKIC